MPKKSARALWADKFKNGGVGSNEKLVPNLKRPAFKGIVLGIDPSLRGSGLAVIDFKDPKVPKLLFSETIKNHPKLSFEKCLTAISRAVEKVIKNYDPEVVAVEEAIYVQNFQTAQILGAARGAAIVTVAREELPIFHYSPLRIKQAVVGFGRASKEQVASQVKGLLRLSETLSFDESDASAVACCHAFTDGKF